MQSLPTAARSKNSKTVHVTSVTSVTSHPIRKAALSLQPARCPHQTFPALFRRWWLQWLRSQLPYRLLPVAFKWFRAIILFSVIDDHFAIFCLLKRHFGVIGLASCQALAHNFVHPGCIDLVAFFSLNILAGYGRMWQDVGRGRGLKM